VSEANAAAGRLAKPARIRQDAWPKANSLVSEANAAEGRLAKPARIRQDARPKADYLISLPTFTNVNIYILQQSLSHNSFTTLARRSWNALFLSSSPDETIS